MTGKRASHARTRISALTATSGAVVKIVIGPMIAASVSVPDAGLLDTVAAGTLGMFVSLHLVRELLIWLWPAQNSTVTGGTGKKRRRPKF
jgi:hypothetical protein